MSNSTAKEAYDLVAQQFINDNPKSKHIYEKACESLPGGNVRTVLYYDPFPLAIASAHDATVVDVDGHEYCDLLGEYTAGLYGHSNPVITKAITDAVHRGLSYGGQHEDEGRLAALIKERIPSIDLLRFTNSGTEANLMNIALAKAYTGKNKIIVFNGCYHGGLLGWKGSTGSALNVPHDFLLGRYNDEHSIQPLLSYHGDDIAAVLVEPMSGSGGGIPATMKFLEFLKHVAVSAEALLIYDEVMTSRMYGSGGIQSQLEPHLRPDLTSLGKWIGGGMSFGAFGGKREYMSLFDPREKGSFAHAGTFNNNVLTMAAGRAGMEQVFTPERAQELHDRGEKLRSELREVSSGTIMQWTGLGSILCVHFITTPAEQIKAPDDVTMADTALGGLFHLWLLQHGYYIGRRGFIALSLAVTEENLSTFVALVKQFVDEYRSLLAMPSLPS